jgi:nucleoside-diphosphate-sugar epimerase
VLGATGFIGTHVARRLAAAGARTLLVSRRPRGPAEPGGEHIARDLTAPGAAAALVAETAPDIVFNLAGYGVDPAERDPGLARRLNAELPGELADALAGSAPGGGWGGQRLVHSGSALEYGRAAGDLDERTEPVPTTLYGETKLAGTLAVLARGRARGLRAICARLFTVYGSGERPGRLLPSLLEVAASRRSLPLTAGRQLRDFTWVGDVAEGLLRLGARAGEGGEGGEGGTLVNLATGRLTSVRDFALTAARVLGFDPELLRFGALPTRAEEMSHEPLTLRRLRDLLRWTPPTGVDEGIRLTATRG